ncbi:MAG: LysR family transcriptional regulator [Deltaproteobacteria bacterium]
MDNELDLTALRAFRAVVRTGSFAAAAHLLNSPKSTLSKRVADLESDLGVRLIERTTRRLRVTAEGEILASRADRILGEAEDLRRAMTESGALPKGHLRIAVPGVLGSMMIGTIAARFRAHHPEITLEILNFDRAPDLLEEGFDGALRFGPLDDSTQVAKLMKNASSIIVASPDLPGIEHIHHPSDLSSLPEVGMAQTVMPRCGLVRIGSDEFVEVQVQRVISLGAHTAVRDAVLAGAGVAVLPYAIARPEILAGRLVNLLPGWSGPKKQIFFIYPAPQSVTARLRALIDHLAVEFATIGPWCPREEVY